jgi:hypothetical protein
MLAYLFWHWPRPDVTAAAYEGDLITYHTALASSAPAGYRGSAVYRVQSAPWIGAPDGGYEDWYLLDGSAVLDPLNEVAVSPPLRVAHDRCARAAAGGAGGLYRLRNSAARWPQTGAALWFGRPAGLTYGELDALLQPALEAGACLWQRQMSLGPALEFCLLVRRQVALPPAVVPTSVACEAIYRPPTGPG